MLETFVAYSDACSNFFLPPFQPFAYHFGGKFALMKRLRLNFSHSMVRRWLFSTFSYLDKGHPSLSAGWDHLIENLTSKDVPRPRHGGQSTDLSIWKAVFRLREWLKVRRCRREEDKHSGNPVSLYSIDRILPFSYSHHPFPWYKPEFNGGKIPRFSFHG